MFSLKFAIDWFICSVVMNRWFPAERPVQNIEVLFTCWHIVFSLPSYQRYLSSQNLAATEHDKSYQHPFWMTSVFTVSVIKCLKITPDQKVTNTCLFSIPSSTAGGLWISISYLQKPQSNSCQMNHSVGRISIVWKNKSISQCIFIFLLGFMKVVNNFNFNSFYLPYIHS